MINKGEYAYLKASWHPPDIILTDKAIDNFLSYGTAKL